MRDFYEHFVRERPPRRLSRLAERATTGYETARRKVAVFVDTLRREVIFTRSATSAQPGRVRLGPRQPRAGDVVVVTELEHHSSVPWQFVAERSDLLPRDPDRQGRGAADSGSRRDRARGTVKVVACNLVSNTLGTVNPAVRLGEWAHERRAIMVVDAARAAPHRPLDVQALGCDFLALSSHKMCGPSGSGALWGRRELLEDVPLQPRRRDDPLVSLEKTTWNELPYKFEAGTPAIAEAVGFGAAVDYVTGSGSTRSSATSTSCSSTRWAGWARSPGSTSTGLLPSGARHRVVQRRRRTHDVAQVLDWEGVAVRAGPLHAAADDQAGRQRDDAGELLPVLDPRGGRPPRGRAPQGQEVARVSRVEFDQLYREVILDHYKNPRNHGLLDPRTRRPRQNPLCGDEVVVSVR